MIELLYIPLMAVFDGSRGGSTSSENYYIKRIGQDPEIRLKLLSFEDFDEDLPLVKKDMQKYAIDADIITRDRSVLAKINRYIYNFSSKNNPFDRNGNFTEEYYRKSLIGKLNRYKKEGYYPKIIVLAWTQIILFIADIKAIYPDSKIISMEEDVSYLGLLRKRDKQTNWLKKWVFDKRYKNLKQSELRALKMSDYVFSNNPKDLKLLIDDGIRPDKINWISPWFHDFSSVVDHNADLKDPYILYYGAMGRPENYLSAIHIIKTVLPNIDERIKLVVVGSKPPESLLRYQNERIKVTGFVESVAPFFEKCLCLVAPIQLGAGIKIKVLESLSAGVPVLTNQIGIEGIEVEDGVDFLFCESTDDYIQGISSIYEERIDSRRMSESAKRKVKEKYNYEKSSQVMIKTIKTLIGEKYEI